jgi:hypothetical protein
MYRPPQRITGARVAALIEGESDDSDSSGNDSHIGALHRQREREAEEEEVAEATYIATEARKSHEQRTHQHKLSALKGRLLQRHYSAALIKQKGATGTSAPITPFIPTTGITTTSRTNTLSTQRDEREQREREEEMAQLQAEFTAHSSPSSTDVSSSDDDEIESDFFSGYKTRLGNPDIPHHYSMPMLHRQDGGVNKRTFKAPLTPGNDMARIHARYHPSDTPGAGLPAPPGGVDGAGSRSDLAHMQAAMSSLSTKDMARASVGLGIGAGDHMHILQTSPSQIRKDGRDGTSIDLDEMEDEGGEQRPLVLNGKLNFGSNIHMRSSPLIRSVQDRERRGEAEE